MWEGVSAGTAAAPGRAEMVGIRQEIWQTKPIGCFYVFMCVFFHAASKCFLGWICRCDLYYSMLSGLHFFIPRGSMGLFYIYLHLVVYYGKCRHSFPHNHGLRDGRHSQLTQIQQRSKRCLESWDKNGFVDLRFWCFHFWRSNFGLPIGTPRANDEWCMACFGRFVIKMH